MLPLAVAAALIAGQAAAEGVDAKAEKELTTAGHRIDKASASADAGRVTTKIVDQWKGTQFKFDATSAPRELTAQDVQDLRQKKLGYGEISLLLALTAKQPDPATAKPVSEIVAMRQDGMGMGRLAKELGYKSLGAVIKSVKATEKGIGTATASARTEKAEKPGKPEKMEKAQKPEKPEKPERPEKPGR
ncbi:MAG TPA: hypothetical protein VFV05_02835 [Methylomirabilota bacterium]|nr:hypothetical protein [Methylomirabilota bacterium]